MFERYAEKARRVIFFARYEASQLGAHQIESEHLLLGLLREDRFLFRLLMPTGWTMESIRRKIEFGAPVREMVSTSVDMPVSSEVKRIFTYAAEESDRLGDSHIETRHLLLGILRERDCVAAKLLREDGVELSSAREIVAGTQAMDEAAPGGGSGPGAVLSRTIEFVNEADDKVLATTSGAPVPQNGSEIVLGEMRARVSRVVYQYDEVSPPADEADTTTTFWLRRIVVYVQITA